MKKRISLLACIIALLLLVSACGTGKDSYTYIPVEELTEEAIEAFYALDGEHGVMVYNDLEQLTRNQVTLYVVLYGPSGHAVSLKAASKELIMQISGEPMEGFAVWRVTYGRKLFSERQISFTQSDEPQVLDGVETLPFVVEAKLIKE